MVESARESYLGTAEAVANLVERIDGEWDRPGLGEWDLRALVGHASRSLVTVLTYLDRPVFKVDLETPEAYYVRLMQHPIVTPEAAAARGVAAGEALGPRPAHGFQLLVAEVTAKLARFDDEAPIETIAGGMRVGAYLVTRTFELVVHGFDIARATGLSFYPPVESTAEACALAGRVAALTGRGEALLMGLTGRSPLPTGFSVV